MAGGGRRGRGGIGGRSGGRSAGRSRGRVEKDVVAEEIISDDELESVGTKQKVCKKIDDAVYRDNKLSEGGKMKEEGKVIQRKKDELKRPENINCRVEDFGLILNEFCEKKRKIVQEMGFSGLFGLVDRQLPRELCYWLVTRVDVPSYSLVTPDGLEFTFDPIQLHWVLGIPKGHLPVPKKAVDEESKHFLAGVLARFSTTNVKGGLSRKNLVQAVEAPLQDVFEFRVAFLLLALVDILCPTTSYRLCPKLLPAAIAAVDPESYDWCSLVLEKVMYSVSSFARRFYPSGFSKGCGGCTIFLAIMYVDRLKRPPVKWGVFPRLKAWTEVEINKAKKADRITGGDFGKLGCVNASYGRPHVRAALDHMPLKRSSMAAEIAEVLMQAVDVEEEDVDGGLISTQGVKKRPKEGRGYFGWNNKASGSCSGSGVHDVHDVNGNDISVSDYIATGLISSPIILNNDWEDSQRREREEIERQERERQEIERERQEKERQEKEVRERQEREQKERQLAEEKDREDQERKEKELQKVREEKEEKERQEREERQQRYEKERQDREDKERVVLQEVERVAREQRERVEEEQRLEREETEREERERVRSEKEQEALDRLEKEKEEYERLNKERAENRVLRGPQSPERIDLE
uniref:Uncharacterized protein n=1 Tax=Chenopodium quinoa TaxID=63459 RepID=A0A803MR83_CHEQI